MHGILHNLPANDVGPGVEGKRGYDATCGPAGHGDNLSLIRCSQRVSLHRTSLVRQT